MKYLMLVLALSVSGICGYILGQYNYEPKEIVVEFISKTRIVCIDKIRDQTVVYEVTNEGIHKESKQIDCLSNLIVFDHCLSQEELDEIYFSQLKEAIQ